MIDILFYIVAFVITLGVLVTVHEWGHFYAARKLGVKVLRFSIGFGMPLWKRTAKDGVEYVIAGIPLGGYVKMLDEREGDVDESLKPMAFNRQALWKRNIIVAAGPIANFVLAILVFWVMFMSGNYVNRAVMDAPVASSIAEKAGIKKNQEVVSVDGVQVKDWKQVTWALVERLGEKGAITLIVKDMYTDSQSELILNIDQWQVDDKKPDVITSLGLVPKRQPDAIIYTLAKNGSAEQQNLAVGDRIIKMNETEISHFGDIFEFMSKVTSSKEIEVQVERERQIFSVFIRPQEEGDRFLIGIGMYPYGIYRSSGPVEAGELAVKETWRMISLTGMLLKKLVTGEVSTRSLGGPFAIAEGAGNSAKSGIITFLSFLGMISVNLGLINLLPVPVLDGGHLLFNLIEAIKGNPVSEAAQEYGTRIGIVLVLGLMVLALFNDIARL